MVDDHGTLVEDIWRLSAEPSIDWRRDTTGDCLCESIVKDME